MMQIGFSIRSRKPAARLAILCGILLAFAPRRASAQAAAGPMRPADGQQASGDSSQPAQTPQMVRPMRMGSYPSSPAELTALEQDMAATLDARLAGWKDSSGAARKPKIVVLDFCTWERQWMQFGTWLADQVSSGLSTTSGQFEVIDRAHLAALTESRRFGSKDEICSNKAAGAAQAVDADFYVTATYLALDKDLGVTLNVVHALPGERQRPLYFVKSRVAMSNEMAAHVGVPFDSFRPVQDTYSPGVNGVSLPKCVYCPSPPFTPEAQKKKISGTVGLRVLITGDGSVSDVELKKSLEPSLDQQAMETVKTWRFDPARDPNGVPVSVRQVIEVSFRFH